MKTYNIEPTNVDVGGDFSYHALSLGERGRGRNIVNVACPETFEFLDVGQTKSGRSRLVTSSESSGWIARICTNGGYKRGASGNVSVPPDTHPHIQVIARGQGAFGIAGRVGSWDDILFSSLEENLWVRVRPSRGDAYVLIFSESSKVTKVDYQDAENILENLFGSSPTNRGDLILL